MEELLQTSLESGGLGAVAMIALCLYFFRQQKSWQATLDRFEDERKNYQEMGERQFNKLADLATSITEAVTQHTSAIRSLEEWIKSRISGPGGDSD